MKKKLKKLNLKKQTLHLLTGSRITAGQNDNSRLKICPVTTQNTCGTDCPSRDSRCPDCWA